MDDGPNAEDVARMRRFAEHYAGKTGTVLHPEPEVTELVLFGMARNRARIRATALPLPVLPR